MIGLYHGVVQRPNALTRIYGAISLLQLFQALSSLSLSISIDLQVEDGVESEAEQETYLQFHRCARSPETKVHASIYSHCDHSSSTYLTFPTDRGATWNRYLRRAALHMTTMEVSCECESEHSLPKRHMQLTLNGSWRTSVVLTTVP